MGSYASGPRVLAVLGPTNTGKTHLAIERMLGHRSGMIGFPLRLLARENYDRVVRLKGPRAVALITGEEKILPPNPSYFVCTVESMPLDRLVDFLAVDEIQLCGDPERGHVFTDRLLHARGTAETMFLGADTIRPILRRLIPEAEIVSRPRFSTLTYTGEKKLARLPPRSAVVAFAVAEVFEIAEAMRRRRGGTAVVLGALSPRARNAQVGMFQAGDVDYLVATDAIGMGLNMDLNHVAFARLVKFDGRAPRRLAASEIAQIAGRAGRHMSDGTFGTTADQGPLDPELVEAIEAHRFDPLARLFWRNARLDFSSVGGLLKSLDAKPHQFGLTAQREADDHRALIALARDPEIAALAQRRDAVQLLWEVCQIPDFRKVMSETHSRLLAQMFRHLRGLGGRLPTDWVAGQVTRLDRYDGDIDTLMNRIAHIRTWTYIANRPDWLENAAHWQERARTIEDRLSDALHDRITQRFVDRHAAFSTRRFNEGRELLASVNSRGEVAVEGELVGKLDGFRFVPDALVADSKIMLAAAHRVLRTEIALRAKEVAQARDGDLHLERDGKISWCGGAVGKLHQGDDILTPRVTVIPGDFLDGGPREEVRRRLADYLRDELQRGLAPLLSAQVNALSGAARGILFRLGETLGSLPIAEIDEQLRALEAGDRKALTQLGLRFGQRYAYFPPLLKPRALTLKAMLWAVHHGTPLHLPPHGTAGERDPALTEAFYAMLGFAVLGPRLLRIDRVETLLAILRRSSRAGPIVATPELAQLASVGVEVLPAVLPALGYRPVVDGEGIVTFHPRSRHTEHKARKQGRRPQRHEAEHAQNPFAKLKELKL